MITASTNQSSATMIPSRSVLRVVLPLAVVVLVGGYFRIQRLSDISYWFDESFCLKMADFPVPELLEHARGDPHPPLFYLVLRPWMLAFGKSTLATRALCVLLGTLTIVGTWLLVREAVRHSVAASHDRANAAALLAAGLVALSPIHISWSYQVRMYALAAALAALSSWLLLLAVTRPRSRGKYWLLYTISAVALGYTHFFGLFTVLAQYAFAAGLAISRRRSRSPVPKPGELRIVCLSAVATGLMGLLWLPAFLQQRRMAVEGFWSGPFSWEGVGFLFINLFGWDPRLKQFAVLGLVIGQVMILVLLGLLASGRRPADILLALVTAVPFVAGILFSISSRNVLMARYFMFAQVTFFAAAAMLTYRIPWRIARGALSACLLGGMGCLAWQQHVQREADAQLPGMRGAVARLDEARGRDEPLVVADPALFTSIVAHTRRPERTFVFHTGHDFPFTHGAAVMRSDEYVRAEDLQASPAQVVWAFDSETWRWSVPMPPGWALLGEERFEEFNGVFVIRPYGRDRPTTALTSHEESAASVSDSVHVPGRR